ncbi:MAG: GTPase Era [Alphaproteobacteria bacterium]|nr:GTPase Era [Alphaproteobacteria bacterium]TAD91996.1 MAG: GTPase Era [Alphaproteobacteria bacterium]
MTTPSATTAPATTAEITDPRCGFVALIGAPNAGKSTLMNALVGSHVSIVSPKVQTTRNRVLGIVVEGSAQVVLIDTPGIFQSPKRRLERAMVQAAWTGAGDADAVALLFDASRPNDAEARALLDRVAGLERPKLLVLNKVDLVKRETLLGLAASLNEAARFERTFMVSALTGSGVDDVRRALASHVAPGPWHYPEDQLADMPMRLLAAELTREQIFLQLHDELPYSAIVETDRWEERPDGSARIDQTITVLRDSQKPIVIGAGGRRIKAISQAARAAIAEQTGREVHLFLHVIVRDDWIEDRVRFRDLGLDYDV